MTRFSTPDPRQGELPGVAYTLRKMTEIPVMQSDFMRYVVIATDGAVYCEETLRTTAHVPDFMLIHA